MYVYCLFNNSELFFTDKFLPLFDCCGHYSFHIDCRQMDGPDYITSILQLLSFGSSVFFEIYDGYHIPEDETTLPIEAISNWLHKPIESINEKREGRYFGLNCRNFENMLEMVDHLKEVAILVFLEFLGCFSYRQRTS